MIVLAILLAGGAPAMADREPFQLMTSRSFNVLAARSERACPARRLRYLHPADLDAIEESYVPTLSRDRQRRIAAADKEWRGCPPAGASCPAQHMLSAIEREHLLGSFVDFACKAQP